MGLKRLQVISRDDHDLPSLSASLLPCAYSSDSFWPIADCETIKVNNDLFFSSSLRLLAILLQVYIPAMPRAEKPKAWAGYHRSNKEVECQYCGKQFNSKGLASHQRPSTKCGAKSRSRDVQPLPVVVLVEGSAGESVLCYTRTQVD